MFLALDIGNSATKIGLHDGQSWISVERVHSDVGLPTAQLKQTLQTNKVKAAGITSVVPARTAEGVTAVREFCDFKPIVVSADLPLPFEMGYETPQTLGADRLAGAVAAWLLFGRNGRRAVIAVDAGTAVTTEVISADGVYLGGAIAPGPDLLLHALSRDTAQLPPIDWPDAPEAVGSSTHAAISAGVSTMFLKGVEGLLDQSSAQLSNTPFVVATGGWAPWLEHHLDNIDVVEPNLVLEGIRLLAS